MARLTPQEAAEKWQRNASNAAGDYKAGVERVREAPGVSAARKYDKWKNSLAASGDKWRANVSAVSREEWVDRTANLGTQRYAQGVQEKGAKMQNFMAEFLPFQDAVTARVKAMDDSTPEARIQRAVAQMRGTMQFRRRSGS